MLSSLTPTPKYTLGQQLPPGRYHKKDFEPKLPHGFIQGAHRSYDVLTQFAKGSTSTVKKIRDRKSGKIYILKIIRPKLGTILTEEMVKQCYETEYRILKKLKRIDPVRIMTQSKTKYEIVMDLAEGSELRGLIKNEKLPKNPKKLLRLSLNILLDLYKIHQLGILLIDDKAENIMVDPATLKVTRVDFGFAEDNYDFKKNPGINTKLRSTLQVSAPEVLEASKHGNVIYNQATDMYTVGVLLRELLMRDEFTIPGFNSNNMTIVVNHPRTSFLKEYAGIKALLLQMTSFQPEKRPLSLEDVIAQFEGALGLKKGSSIAKLKKEEALSQKLTLEDKSQPNTPSANPAPSVHPNSITKNFQKPTDSKSMDPHPTLTDAQLKQAWLEYKKEKDKFFGIRWPFMSESTFEIMMELKNQQKHFITKKDKNIKNELFYDSRQLQYYYYEENKQKKASKQEQYETAKNFISNNPHTTFAKKLANAMQDPELIQKIHDARPCWRRCFG